MNPTHTNQVTQPTTADVLDKAADYIEQHGWNQGSHYSDSASLTPAADVLGALTIVAHGAPVEFPHNVNGPGFAEFSQALSWLTEYLHAQRRHVLVIDAWNDHPDTTGQDITDTIRAAADAWRTEHTGGER